MTNIIIEEPVLGDEKGLVFVHKKTWLTTYPNKKYKIFKKDILLKDFDSEKKLNKWKKTIKNNGKEKSYVCVAKDGIKVVGFCLVSKEEKTNELNAIYILSEYQKMGIGKKLLDKAFGWLGNKKKITLTVVAYNNNAHAFYEKYGFVRTGKTCKKGLPNGKIIPEVQMIYGK
jgi:ribosomal protein S18 acetylase RimI-like enzyme